MAYDVEQQESISAMKAWFDRYGNWVVGASLLALALVAGNWSWRWYQGREAAAASALFEQYEAAVNAKEDAKARDLAGTLVQQYGSSAYAGLASLAQARRSLDAGDAAAAKAQLQWVIDKSGDREFAALARVRLAGILLDEKAYEPALALLAADPPKGMAAEYADRRGDILAAQGKNAEARAAYAKALEQAAAQDPLRALIQSKLDGLPAAG
jgi:predicted negative regulator of RcsB-dependent stress response